MNRLEVQHSGALRNLMSGNLKATISLDTLESVPHLYALGALENLKGEVQIFDGKASITSSVNDNEVSVSQEFDQKAALLVYAQVPEWSDPIDLDEVKLQESLEKQIKTAAVANGTNINKPFPFLIKGKAELLQWHVIDWPDGDQVHTHKKHQESGSHDILENEDVEILGFYSEKHKAVFTHHSTFLHMHFKTDSDSVIAGHVDDLQGKGLQLYLPKK